MCLSVENLRLGELYQCFAAPAMKAKGKRVPKMPMRRAYMRVIGASSGEMTAEKKFIPLLGESSREHWQKPMIS
jgi:hypothetical protein